MAYFLKERYSRLQLLSLPNNEKNKYGLKEQVGTEVKSETCGERREGEVLEGCKGERKSSEKLGCGGLKIYIYSH